MAERTAKVAVKNIIKPPKNYKQHDRLLRELPTIVHEFELDGLAIEILDSHILPRTEYCGLKDHTHSFIEIHVPFSGKGRISSAKKSRLFNPGKFTITFPGEIHNWISVDSDIMAQIWWLNIQSLNSPPATEMEKIYEKIKNANQIVYKLPQDYMLYYNLAIDELKNKKICYDNFLIDCVQMTIISLLRATVSAQNIHSKRKYTSQNETRLEKLVNQFIEDNLDKHITTHEIAAHLKMSLRTAMRRYKRCAGITIGQRLKQTRMRKAERLLRETDFQIKAVAYQCGFHDLSYFSKLFKGTTNLSPSAYRSKFQ